MGERPHARDHLARRIERFGDRAIEALDRIDQRLADLGSIEGRLAGDPDGERPALEPAAPAQHAVPATASVDRATPGPAAAVRRTGHAAMLALGAAIVVATALIVRRRAARTTATWRRRRW